MAAIRHQVAVRVNHSLMRPAPIVTSGNSGSMVVMRSDPPRLSVALVGLGTIARTHLLALAGQPNVDLTVVVDPAVGKEGAFRGRPVEVRTDLDVDSGTNQLTMLSRLVEVVGRGPLHEPRSDPRLRRGLRRRRPPPPLTLGPPSETAEGSVGSSGEPPAGRLRTCRRRATD
jgi:hypothetical protein